MTDRRVFLQSALMASALAAGPLARMPAAAANAPSLAFERFVFDARFAEAVEAARRAAASGVPLAETTGDVTSLWYRDLDLSWRRAPMTLAGVTTRGALFVLETLAADRGMRVLYRGEHAAAGVGTEPGTKAAGRADLFAALMPAELERRTRSAARHDELLCSWIIAPRSLVAVTA
jgi:hypothetical protein